jgi:hypothetical protein
MTFSLYFGAHHTRRHVPAIIANAPITRRRASTPKMFGPLPFAYPRHENKNKKGTCQKASQDK